MSNQVQNLNLKSCREAHADALVELGKKDKKVKDNSMDNVSKTIRVSELLRLFTT